MAAKLQVRLTFEGGEEMKKALAEIGVKGGSTMKGLGSAADAVGAAFGALGDVVKTVATGIAAVGGVVGATAAGIFALAKSSASAADEAGKAAQKIGVNAKAYQELAFAAKLADVEQDSLQSGLKALNKNIVEAADGNKDLAAAFASVGIKLKTSGVLTNLQKFQLAVGDIKTVPKTLITAEQAILGLADAFKGAPDGPRKTALALQLLGKSGSDLIPLLNSGSKEIVGLGREAERLGLVFDDKAIKASEEFNDTLTILEGAFTGVKNAIGQVFLPELTDLAKRLTDFIVNNRDEIVAWIENGWKALKQIIEDVIASFSGRDADVVNKWTLSVRDGWVAVKQIIEDVIAIFSGRDADVVNKWILTVRDDLTSVFTVASGIAQVLLGIVAAVKAPFQALGQLAVVGDAISALGPKNKLGPITGFAAGGHVHGPGNGTSDSILARLSRGEFVIKSAIVDRLGAPFLHALNSGMVPAFAGGGQVGGRPVNLHLDGKSFGLSGGEGVVAQLTRAARSRSLRSPGRAPSWKTRT